MILNGDKQNTSDQLFNPIPSFTNVFNVFDKKKSKFNANEPKNLNNNNNLVLAQILDFTRDLANVYLLFCVIKK